MARDHHLDSSGKLTYLMGSYVLAFAFFLNGAIGLTLTRTAKQDFNRCQHVMFERLFGGSDLNPSPGTLEGSYVFFNFVFITHRLMMVALAYLIVQARQLELAGTLGFGLVAWDALFFTNPLLQVSDTERANMTKLLVKQVAFVGVCLLLTTYGKQGSAGGRSRDSLSPRRPLNQID
eukprot:CAMPEP_0170457560 /NCGR_PEP_ID=MMETSP0123-20130129/4813_1 /TAXON_ID=182087 /ORGANISM="Favella ehrenbergii, Strain Fehren 1" /LENGTH=176 /DNA_ID=CAMNT_0010721397 /DNA_START=1 /DNA_END=531 /DNA_ORIENTATION=+